MREFYGARPLHLLAMLGCLALAGYAALRVAAEPSLLAMLVWFGGAVVAHDLVLFPLYALADRSLVAGLRRRHTRLPSDVPVLNHVRVPALAAGLLFLLFFPGILQLETETYATATGTTQEPFLERWLLICAALFAVSALVYAARLAVRVSGRSPAARG